MPRKRFADMNCSIAQSLEVLGDWWTLLLVREAFFGTTRFGDFERNLGIAKNILSARLEHLVAHGVFSQQPVGAGSKRQEYRLTPMGKDLLAVMTALRDWSDRWIYGAGNEPVIFRDLTTGERVAPLKLRGESGRLIDPRQLRAEAGPGADAATRARFRAAAANRVSAPVEARE